MSIGRNSIIRLVRLSAPRFAIVVRTPVGARAPLLIPVASDVKLAARSSRWCPRCHIHLGTPPIEGMRVASRGAA
jgi:hypothetical protein